MTIERLVTALAPVAQHTPHCIAEMLHWLADELQKGFIDGDGPVAATPLPLAILAQLSGLYLFLGAYYFSNNLYRV